MRIKCWRETNLYTSVMLERSKHTDKQYPADDAVEEITKEQFNSDASRNGLAQK